MNGSNNGKVQYGVPIATKAASKRARKGRQCQVIGCVTLLSTYNSSATCWLHTGAVPRHALAPSIEPA
jgi:hypothetical protein